MRASLSRASTQRPAFTGENQRRRALASSSRVMRAVSDDVNVIDGAERLSTEYQTFLYVLVAGAGVAVRSFDSRKMRALKRFYPY